MDSININEEFKMDKQSFLMVTKLWTKIADAMDDGETVSLKDLMYRVLILMDEEGKLSTNDNFSDIEEQIDSLQFSIQASFSCDNMITEW